MRVKDGQPKIQFQTFADMINFPVKPGEQPETSTSITEVLPLELLEGYPNHEEHFPLYTGARLSAASKSTVCKRLFWSGKQQMAGTSSSVDITGSTRQSSLDSPQSPQSSAQI